MDELQTTYPRLDEQVIREGTQKFAELCCSMIKTGWILSANAHADRVISSQKSAACPWIAEVPSVCWPKDPCPQVPPDAQQ